LDVRKAFGFVRDDVLKTTGNRQEPFVYGSLGGNDVPLVPVKLAPAAAAPNPQAEARADYELALQIGNKDAFNAFLAQHPDGFYANLARIQLAKIAAEETRVAATEKARQAEQERARLAAVGAQNAQQAKADADAKAAEKARLAAEQAKEAAQAQANEAERKRVATDAPASLATRTAPDNKASSPAVGGTNLASLNAGPPQADLIKSVQTELRRVGCLTGGADGEWNVTSQRSLALFNKNAGTKFDVKLASLDALDAIKLKPSRVCPLICEHGFKADGDHCSKIVCAEGSVLDADNDCVKRRATTPTAKREPAQRPDRAAQGLPRPVAPQASGQIMCDDHLCRPVQRGCHLEFRTSEQGGSRMGGGSNIEICN
jgi:hypothetical protein